MKCRLLVLLSLGAPAIASAQESGDQTAVIRQAASGSEIDVAQVRNRASVIRIDQRGAANHVEVTQEDSMSAVLEIAQSASAQDSWVRARQRGDGAMRISQSGTGAVAWTTQERSEATGNQSIRLQQHNGSFARVQQEGRDLSATGRQTGVATTDYNGPLVNRALVGQLGFENRISFDQAGTANDIVAVQGSSDQALNDTTLVQKGIGNTLRLDLRGSYADVRWQQTGDRLTGELQQINFENDVTAAQQGTDLSLSIEQQGSSRADVVQGGSNSSISLRQTR